MRVVRCSEPERFQPAGYWASQGLETEEQVRWEMLWQAATSETDVAKQALQHAEGCDYCGDVLDRFRRVSYSMKPGRVVNLAICPSSSTLVDFLHQGLSPEVTQKVSSHLQKCKICSRELKWLARSERRSKRPVIMTPRAKLISLLAAAAAVLIGAVFFVTVKSQTAYTPIKDTVYSSRYRDLARLPLLERSDLVNAAPPDHWESLDKAMSALELGDTRRAVGLAARLITKKDEPAAEYVLGRALYRERMVSASEEALLKSEQMSPPSAYRCWTALQIALILGNKPVIFRECDHLAKSPKYGEQVAKILGEVKRRG
jgi:hypothetical protein